MFWIRTGNALRIMAYPLVLVVWGSIALANNKTGLSAICAMILSGAHLLASYLYGGLSAVNPNFWLSFVIAIGVGAIAGRKIYELKEKIETPTFRELLPSFLILRNQVGVSENGS
jgi:hypothetical protein